MPVDHIFWPSLAFALGAVWGSFANVVVHRLPRGESVVRPASRCPSCKTTIRKYHNIPILSWFVLRGRCAACSAPFSIRYPLVEAATAALAAAIWMKLSHPVEGSLPGVGDVMVAWVFVFAITLDLIVIALIDLDTMRIPDILSLPGIVLGVVLSALAWRITGVDVESSILGVLFGGGAILAVTYGYFALTGREGMGLGDYRLMAMAGAFLGWRSLLFLFVASAMQGLVYALVVRAVSPASGLPASEADDADAPPKSGAFRHMAIPFGPFIVLSALEWFILESSLMDLFNRWIYIN